jgi:hypothetical protein
MRVRHSAPEASSRQETDEPVSFLIGGAASWLSLAPVRQSRYEGWYQIDSRSTPAHATRILDRIDYLKDGHAVVPSSLTLADNQAHWGYGDGLHLGMALLPGGHALRIEASRSAPLRITLDIRGAYQQPEFGRLYQITEVERAYHITYSDPLLGSERFLVLLTDGGLERSESWQPVSYPWDSARHSPPDHAHIFTLGVVTAKWVALGYGDSLEEARAAAERAAQQDINLMGVGITRPSASESETVQTATSAAARTLELLTTPGGLYAGFPWFHQVWSRDELIAALGLEKEAQQKTVERYLTYTLDRGELPTYQGAGTTCADGLGWLCLLIREMGTDSLPSGLRAQLTSFLIEAEAGLRQRATPEGFIISGHNATWMDTIGRAGVRVEIQAMYALLLELIAALTGETNWSETRTAFLSQVRDSFWVAPVLSDGQGDATVRPNTFLAYLFASDLLDKTSWEMAFTHTLSRLATPWGGLTSLDTSHPDFQKESTGQDNRSYHQGDSWFFINNLAAVVLYRFDKERYKKAISEILGSSTEEILWKHTAGQAGEIASAHSGTSWGCGTQAFSAGTYLFLTRELRSGR